MRKNILTAAAATAFAASLALAAPATAAVTFDSATGTGFVGKGDVQLAFGWNNTLLQSNAAGVTFAAVSQQISEVGWECTNDNNEKIQEREQTTTSSKSGVLSNITRDNKTKAVTGFILKGYAEGTLVTSTETAGPKLNSCPSGPWSLTTPAGEPQVISNVTTLTATHGSTTVPLQ